MPKARRGPATHATPYSRRKLAAELVGADGAQEAGQPGIGEHPLRHADGVLVCSAGNVLHLMRQGDEGGSDQLSSWYDSRHNWCRFTTTPRERARMRLGVHTYASFVSSYISFLCACVYMKAHSLLLADGVLDATHDRRHSSDTRTATGLLRGPAAQANERTATTAAARPGPALGSFVSPRDCW